MVLATDLIHMMDPSGAPQNVNFDEPVATFDARYVISGAAAPIGAEYVVISLDGDLTDERVLTGTANQIAIADGGAGGNVTLSTPQDIHTAATPEFDGVVIGSADGIDCNPGSDIDTDLITVGVTGAPKLWWDESQNAFQFLQGDLFIFEAGETLFPRIQIRAVMNTGNTSWNSQRARGNAFGSEAAVQIYDTLGVFAFWGYHGADYGQGGKLTVATYENFSAGNYGTRMLFNFADIGSTVLAEVMRLQGGRVFIGGGNPLGKLHVDQKSTTANIPVLYLDQADISEEFIKFVGAAASGVLTQSIVDEGDQASETLEGWIKINVNDVGNQITDQDYFIPIYTLSA